MEWVRLPTAATLANFGFAGATLQERGLWITLAMLIHAGGADDGCLRHKGRPLTTATLAAMARADLAEVEGLLGRLEEAGLFDRADDGAIRMQWVGDDLVKANEIGEKRRLAALKGVEQRSQRQKPSTKTSAKSAASSTSPANAGQVSSKSPAVRTNGRTDERNEHTQQHAPGGSVADAAAGEAAPGDEHGDEEHDERLVALAGAGVTGAKAAELVALPWVTVPTIQREKARLKAGEGSGLLITRLEVDERGRWEAANAADQAKAAAEAERERTLEQQREALAKAAVAEEAGDEELLAETGEAELMAAMERLPNMRARSHVRTLTPERRDGRGLPVDRALRHLVAVEVRESRKRRAILAKVRPTLVSTG